MVYSERIQFRIDPETWASFTTHTFNASERLRHLIRLDIHAHGMTQDQDGEYRVSIIKVKPRPKRKASPTEVLYMSGIEEISINGDVRKVRQNKRKAKCSAAWDGVPLSVLDANMKESGMRHSDFQ